MGTYSLFLLTILALSSEMVSGDSVESLHPQVLGEEGGSVTLSCTFSSSYTGALYLFWYRHYPAPQYILHKGNKGSFANAAPFARERFTSEVTPTATHLSIREVRMEDSGSYLCALQDGNFAGSKLVFGTGTIMRVMPKTERTEPSVYKLRAKNGDSDSVCLITDIPNPNTTVSMQDDDKTIDLNNISVLDSSSSNIWRYSAVVLENPSCNLQYDSKEITAKSDTDDDPETCTSMSLGEHFKTNPSLNSVSLTVFGLRILTAKAIIFNLILTVRLWSS